MASLTGSIIRSVPDEIVGAVVRKARDCIVELPAKSDGGHRATSGYIVDYRIEDITEGSARAIGTVPYFTVGRKSATSPWHYHECDLQLVIAMDGSMEESFDTAGRARLARGDIMYIPGDTPHDGDDPTENWRAIEITFPGVFRTIETDAPAPGTPSLGCIWGIGAANRVGAGRGYRAYAYPVDETLNQRYRVLRECRARLDPFERGTLSHRDRYRYMVVLAGSRCVEIDGTAWQLEEGDILVIPRHAECLDVASSVDFEALWVHQFA